jgi:hypothetical protein
VTSTLLPAGNLHRVNLVSFSMACRALSNMTWKADTPLDITVRYSHHGHIKMCSNSTVAELREKIMRLTYITPDYQWLTPAGGHAPLRGNDRDDQRILSDVFGKKKVVDLSKSSCVTSYQDYGLTVALRACHMYRQSRRRKACSHLEEFHQRFKSRNLHPRHSGHDFPGYHD